MSFYFLQKWGRTPSTHNDSHHGVEKCWSVTTPRTLRKSVFAMTQVILRRIWRRHLCVAMAIQYTAGVPKKETQEKAAIQILVKQPNR